MPFDLKTSNVLRIFLIITTLISFGVAFKIIGMSFNYLGVIIPVVIIYLLRQHLLKDNKEIVY